METILQLEKEIKELKELKVKAELRRIYHIEIRNQAQSDMIKKYGLFITYFLFWMKKYDLFYS